VTSGIKFKEQSEMSPTKFYCTESSFLAKKKKEEKESILAVFIPIFL
jgi:hypothetical protein